MIGFGKHRLGVVEGYPQKGRRLAVYWAFPRLRQRDSCPYMRWRIAMAVITLLEIPKLRCSTEKFGSHRVGTGLAGCIIFLFKAPTANLPCTARTVR